MTGAERAGCEQLMYESEVMMMEGVSPAQTVTDVDTLVTTLTSHSQLFHKTGFWTHKCQSGLVN